MARRFTVSVPDALAQRLDAHRHNLSPSEVMQDALLNALAQLEGTSDYGLSLAVRREVEDLNADRILREAAIGDMNRRQLGAEQSARAAQADAACQLGTHYLPGLVRIAAEHDADLAAVLSFAAQQLAAVHAAWLEQLRQAAAAAG